MAEDIKYIYSQLIDVTKLPTKTVTWEGPHSLQEAATFLHLYDIFCEDYLDWTVHYYYSDSNKHSIVFVTSQPSSLQFLLLRKGYYNVGIKAVINGVGANYSQDKAIKTVAKDNDGTTTYQISIDLKDFQGFLDIRYSYMQNGDYTYSELFEQGEHDVRTSDIRTDVWKSGEYKNGYPKVEIPLYGINDKCIRGYSNIFAVENKGWTKEKLEELQGASINLEDIDTYYGNTLSADLINTYPMQDTTKLSNTKQFRSKSFGLVKSTGKYKTLYKWSDYPAEQRVKITVEYNGTEVIIKTYGIQQQVYNLDDWSDLKDDTYHQSLGPVYSATYHSFHKTELDLMWEYSNWEEKCVEIDTITYATKEPSIIFEVYQGEVVNNFNTYNTMTPSWDSTDCVGRYNNRDVSGIEFNTTGGHYYQINIKSTDSDNFKIKPSLYTLILQKDKKYEFYMTNFLEENVTNPNLYFCSKMKYSNLPNWMILYKADTLRYTVYDGKVTLPSGIIKLDSMNTDFYEPTIYYINTNDAFIRSYFDTRDDNTTYLISINIGRPLSSSSSVYKSLFVNSWEASTVVETIYNNMGSDHCRIFLPNFIETNINYANIKGLPTPEIRSNTKVSYNFISDYRKNYFLNYIDKSSLAGVVYHHYDLCPAFTDGTTTLKWKQSEQPLYGLNFTFKDSQTKVTESTNWIEELILTNYSNQVSTTSDFNQYKNYSALIIDNEKWIGGNQQNKYIIVPPYPKTVQSLNGGTITNLVSASNPRINDQGIYESTLCIYPKNNYSIGGLVIYAKEDN